MTRYSLFTNENLWSLKLNRELRPHKIIFHWEFLKLENNIG
nr:MAG TPA: hypothetical protein [Caudoviricetes sp.]